MLLKVEIQIKKVIATDGKVGGQKGEEVRNKLVIIVIIFRNLGSKNCANH